MCKIRILLGALVLLVSGQVGAAIITHGNLTTDDTTNIIVDTLNGVEYLRFDTFNLSFADTLTAVGVGGLYEGWIIANDEIADLFLEALFGPSNPCAGSGNPGTTVCGTISGWTDGDFGESWSEDSDDLFAFTSQTSIDLPIGYVRFNGPGSNPVDGIVQQKEAGLTVPILDELGIDNPGLPVNLLLTRDISPDPCSGFPGGGNTGGEFPGGGNTGGCFPGNGPSAVPIPATVWLFGTGLIGLIGFSKRRNQLAS